MSKYTPEPLLKTLKWKRSEEGCTETHCGHYSIEPIYNHATTPQGYNLFFYEVANDARTRVKIGYLDTQIECKDRAYRHNKRR